MKRFVLVYVLTASLPGPGFAQQRRDSRYWRFGDLESILRISPFTLLVNVYERGSVRPFAFDLKAPIPDDAFDYVWHQVNRPTNRTGGAR